MDKLHKITSNDKEKELALSLFRIPINFFAEDKKNPDVKTSSSGDAIEMEENSSSSTSTTPDKEIKLSQDTPSASVNLEFDDIESTTKKISKEDKAQELKDKFAKPVEKINDTKDRFNAARDHLNYDIENSKAAGKLQDVKDKLAVPGEKLNDAKDRLNAAKDHLKYTAGDKLGNSKPAQKAKDLKDKLAKPGEKLNDAKDKINAKKDDLKDKAKDKLKDSKAGKKAQELRDKYSPRKKIDNARDKINAKKDELKNRAKDKFNDTKVGKKLNDIKNSPAVSKATEGLNKAKELKDKALATKDAIENFDAKKMAEQTGDAAVKIASKAGDAVVPGAGKAIGAADKLVGNTKVGKVAKKLIGCITCGVGCLIPLIVIILVTTVILAPIMWITNLFGGHAGRSAIVGELTEKEFEDLQKASKAYSMEEYEDFTTKLNNPNWWQNLWGTASKYPIEESLDYYLTNYYYYNEKLIKNYNHDYKDLIKKNYIPQLNGGDLTSFGMSFELLISHYNLSTLKAPSSSPQRTKEVDGKTVTYYLDTNGEHMQLFEDVLKSTDPETMNNSNNLLVSRFNGQVSKKWFIDDGSDISSSSDFSKWLDSEDKKENVPDKVKSLTNTSKDVPISLSTILNTKIKDVYIKEYNELRDLSLRDLLEITSTNSYDTQYYASLVKNILKDTSHIGNIKMNKLFTVLTKRLASLELMTYMLYYQKYEKAIESFTNSIAKYDNSNRFEKSFFDQFLTLSHVQHFIALSSSISDPSLAYEIAVASFEAASEGIEIEELPYNYVGIKKYTNWFATYHFTNSVYATDDGVQFYMNISDVIPTYTQQQLFDKYNVNRGIYDKLNAPSEDMDESEKKIREEENAELNQKAFFEIFETATGIDTAFDSNGNFSLRTDRTINYNCAPGKFFPIDSNAYAYISLGFGEYYSEETLKKIGRTENRPEGHHGIDYAIVEGTELFAVSSGTVVFASYSDGYGNYVKIQHDDGYVSIYAHGNGIFHVNVNEHVDSGAPIMQSGNSGSSSGAHLHLEMYDPNGTRINPNDYLYGNL